MVLAAVVKGGAWQEKIAAMAVMVLLTPTRNVIGHTIKRISSSVTVS